MVLLTVGVWALVLIFGTTAVRGIMAERREARRVAYWEAAKERLLDTRPNVPPIRPVIVETVPGVMETAADVAVRWALRVVGAGVVGAVAACPLIAIYAGAVALGWLSP